MRHDMMMIRSRDDGITGSY